MADELRSPEGAAPAAQAQQWQADASDVSTVYTNFCRASMTPEELVLDFGLSTQLQPNPGEPVKLTHRVVMNFYTAKRLLGLLSNIVQTVENNYGALELDFQRRMRPGRAASPTTFTPKQ
ncbi:MAG: DUF3467 domain-containing protein [Planctomycetes bacterium]|jgi:hypothetical protein|nr:DUF3467 domain-containing protein [Planctomycetota bacterium]